MSELDVLESCNSRRLGTFALALGLLVLAFGYLIEHTFVMAAGAVSAMVGLWSLLDRRVKLRIDDLGVWYAPWGPMPVQWGEIAAFETVTLRGVEQVWVIPLYPEQILERMPAWYRWATWLTEKVWGGRFLISTSGLEHGTPFLLETLRRYHGART